MTTARAAIVGPDEGEILGDGNSSLRLLTDASDTDGALSSLEIRLAPGADGAAPHFHTVSAELFYVIEGELQVLVDDRIVTAGAGSSIVVPKRMVHAFGATPGAATRLLIALTPGTERFGYFRLLERIRSGDATYEELLASQDTYDNHYVDAPAWWAERAALRT